MVKNILMNDEQIARMINHKNSIYGRKLMWWVVVVRVIKDQFYKSKVCKLSDKPAKSIIWVATA